MTSEEHKNLLIKFGRHLQVLREDKELSLRGLAKLCDLEHSDIQRYENGKTNLTFVTLIELAKGLGISIAELMNFE